MPCRTLTEQDIDDIIEKFHNLHKQAYGHCMIEDPLEFVNYRVNAVGTFSKPDLLKNAIDRKTIKADEKVYGRAIFDSIEHIVPIINRDTLNIGETIEGPAIIAEMGATVVVYPKHTAKIDELRNIVMYTNIII